MVLVSTDRKQYSWILSFSYLQGKSEKSREFSKEYAIINYESDEVGVFVYNFDIEGNVK